MPIKLTSLFGTVRYYNENNQLHREVGPAVEYANGDKLWYVNGYLHRSDGPAVEWTNGNKFYCLFGIEVSKTNFMRFISKSKNIRFRLF